MNLLVETGLLLTAGGLFGPADPNRLQNVQTPYFLIETGVAQSKVVKLYADNRVENGKVTSYLLQLGLETREPGVNWGLGFQDEQEPGFRKEKTGQVVYFKLSYKWSN